MSVSDLDYCALCGEDFQEGERRRDAMDGRENPFKAHERCYRGEDRPLAPPAAPGTGGEG
jgi:hypothetical protein